MPQMGPLPWGSLCLSTVVFVLSGASLLYFFFNEEKPCGIITAPAVLDPLCTC